MKYSLLPVVTISCIPVVLIASCSQNNTPSQASIHESLQKELPRFTKIESFQVEKSENLGTETEPKIQARFKANLKINEDLYVETGSESFVSYLRAEDTKFIKKRTDKGKKVDMYGLSISERYEDTWKTDFKLESDPFRGLGNPRIEYGPEAIVKGSEEEKKYNQRIENNLKKYKKEAISKLFNKTNSGHLDGGFRKHQFELRLTSDEKDVNNVKGTITFGKIVKGVEGEISDDKISFLTTEIVDGKELDGWGLGTKYLFDLDDQFPNSNSLIGTWERKDKSNGHTTIRID